MTDQLEALGLLMGHLIRLRFTDPKMFADVACQSVFVHRAAAAIDVSTLSVEDRATMMRLIDRHSLVVRPRVGNPEELLNEPLSRDLVANAPGFVAAVEAIVYRLRAKAAATPSTPPGRAANGEVFRLKMRIEKIVRQRRGEMPSINELVKATRGKRSSVAAAIKDSVYLATRQAKKKSAQRKYQSVSAAPEASVLSAANAKSPVQNSASGGEEMVDFFCILPGKNVEQNQLSDDDANALRERLIKSRRASEREQMRRDLSAITDDKLLEFAELLDEQSIEMSREEPQKTRRKRKR